MVGCIIGVEGIVFYRHSPGIFILAGCVPGGHGDAGEEFFTAVILLPLQQNKAMICGLGEKTLDSPSGNLRFGDDGLHHQLDQNGFAAAVGQID